MKAPLQVLSDLVHSLVIDSLNFNGQLCKKESDIDAFLDRLKGLEAMNRKIDATLSNDVSAAQLAEVTNIIDLYVNWFYRRDEL